MICAPSAEHGARFGVASICRALSAHGCWIAPNTYYAWAGRAPKRSLWDTTITEVLAGCYQPDEHGRRAPESLYGSLKMWAQLRRQGIEVARCTVERITRANGWRGATRTKRVRTTIADPAATRAPDLVDRQFRTGAPNVLFMADFTYVPMATGGHTYTGSSSTPTPVSSSAGSAPRRSRRRSSNGRSGKPPQLTDGESLAGKDNPPF